MDRFENVTRTIEFESSEWVPVYLLSMNPENTWTESDFNEFLYTHPRDWKPSIQKIREISEKKCLTFKS